MSADVFAERRERFMSRIDGAPVLIGAGTPAVRNRDVEHPFRQDSDFFYLTGFDEPEAAALLDPAGDHPFVLFVRPRSREDEIWTGTRVGVEGARERLGADAAFPIKELEARLRERLLGKKSLYYQWGNRTADGAVERVLTRLRTWHDRTGKPVPMEVHDPGPILAEMRLRKTPEDIRELRHACSISVQAHLEAMRLAAPGLFEYQVQAGLEFVFRMLGSLQSGYPSIVAGGANACVLHYTRNDDVLREGDLLLIDAGAEHGYLSADITRTFPVNGRFSPSQRAVYDIVREAHRAALSQCEPGASLRDLHETSKRVISEGLVELGLVPGSVDDVLSMHLYREYFMHGTSHWLGMDVHDVGTYRVDGNPRPLEPGMTFTVEPGLYVSPDETRVTFRLLSYDVEAWAERRALLGTEEARALEQKELEAAPKVRHEIPAEFRGIGARIEDDVLITPSGFENLTEGVPVDPSSVEAVCREGSVLPVL